MLKTYYLFSQSYSNKLIIWQRFRPSKIVNLIKKKDSNLKDNSSLFRFFDRRSNFNKCFVIVFVILSLMKFSFYATSELTTFILTTNYWIFLTKKILPKKINYKNASQISLNCLLNSLCSVLINKYLDRKSLTSILINYFHCR